jgi:hypothetical protein
MIWDESDQSDGEEYKSSLARRKTSTVLWEGIHSEPVLQVNRGTVMLSVEEFAGDC